MAFDSIVHEAAPAWELSPGVSPDSFAAPHWKLITEGGSWAGTEDSCMQDVCAAAPYRGLCSSIDADDGHTCTYQSFPEHPHCTYYNTHMGELCIDWFRGL